jgi:phosphocarrier protein
MKSVTVTVVNPAGIHTRPAALLVQTVAKFKSDFHINMYGYKINGKSMRVWMEKVEQRLNILTPNSDMEKEWDELRRLGERYRKLEKKCQEKSQMWNALKKMPPLKL